MEGLICGLVFARGRLRYTQHFPCFKFGLSVICKLVYYFVSQGCSLFIDRMLIRYNNRNVKQIYINYFYLIILVIYKTNMLKIRAKAWHGRHYIFVKELFLNNIKSNISTWMYILIFSTRVISTISRSMIILLKWREISLYVMEISPPWWDRQLIWKL